MKDDRQIAAQFAISLVLLYQSLKNFTFTPSVYGTSSSLPSISALYFHLRVKDLLNEDGRLELIAYTDDYASKESRQVI